MSISWKPWASLGSPSPADAHDAHACGAHHEVTAAGGSNIIEFAGAAPRRPKTCPNATRNACAFRSHSPANFEFPRPCRRHRRGAHHEHQRDPRDAAEEGRRQWRASLKGFAFSSGGPRPRPQKGPAALPDLMAAASAADPQSCNAAVLINTSNVAFEKDISCVQCRQRTLWTMPSFAQSRQTQAGIESSKKKRQRTLAEFGSERLA